MDNSIDLFSNVTPQVIEEQILERMGGIADTREGSYTRNLIAGAAHEIDKVYKSMNLLLPIAFVDETSGKYLDARCEEFGMERKPGVKAKAVLRVDGLDGTRIPKGTTFATAEGLTFLSDEEVSLSGATLLSVTAAEIGSQYNVAAGKITALVDAASGVPSITNPEAAAGGADPETDESLFRRLNDFRKKPATSGNANHYVQWALETPGVGGAKAEPAWNGGGTVRVLLVGNEKEPVDEAIVQSCKEHIETQRPICVEVTVESAKATPIGITAKLETDGTATVENILSEYKKQLGEYLQSVSFERYTILYNRLAFLLLGIDGVVNYQSFLVNGGTENISIAADTVPVLGEVVIA